MKVLVLGATGGTGRLIVRDALAKGHSVVALVRSKASADLPGVDMIEGDARDEGTLIRALNGLRWRRQLVGASGPSPTSQASMAARLHAPMSLGSWWSN